MRLDLFAVQGIYKAKQRPADNPLIVHFASLAQLRRLLRPSKTASNGLQVNGHAINGFHNDPIPEIYRPLISKFWPGPLTIILPNPPRSPLASEVTAGLNTFGARIPRHVLALALIQIADKPIAAPSANASTRPSPTAAEHVLHDLEGRIETIVDGGPCDVGVESTVVDGLSSPPLVLRPGGISLEQLRTCPGWEETQIGYKDASETANKPKAPGMKYRHYSPKARVVLYEPDATAPSSAMLFQHVGATGRLGLITTKRWQVVDLESSKPIQRRPQQLNATKHHQYGDQKLGFAGMLQALLTAKDPIASIVVHDLENERSAFQLFEIALGSNTADVARGIFSALREMDRADVDTILVEGIDETEGDTAAAIMNRLRKAAEINVTG